VTRYRTPVGDQNDLRSRIEAQVLARRLGTAPAKHDRADHSDVVMPTVTISPDLRSANPEPPLAPAGDRYQPSAVPYDVPAPTANGHETLNGHDIHHLGAVNGDVGPGLNGSGAGLSEPDVSADAQAAAVGRRLADARARLGAAGSFLTQAQRGQERAEAARQLELDHKDQILRLIAAVDSAETSRHAEALRRVESEARAAALEQRLAVAEELAARLDAARIAAEQIAAEQIAAEQIAAEQIAAEQIAAEQIAAEQIAETGRVGQVTADPYLFNEHEERSTGYAEPPNHRTGGTNGDFALLNDHSLQFPPASVDDLMVTRAVESAAARHRRSDPDTGARVPAATRVLRRGGPRVARGRVALRLGAVAVVAVIAAVLLRSFVVASYYIPSASMEPTLHGCSGCNNDHILVDKLSYKLHSVHRGDVIVFDRPATADSVTNEKVLIKRVVGLPGDVLTDRDGIVYLNGQALAEPYVNPACKGTQSFPSEPVTVPKGDIYVMGDNRCDSLDSRSFGAVPESLIVGRAFIIIWPLGRLHYL
jgi:signal peptidase I